MCAACGRFSDPGQGQGSVIHTSPDRTQCFCIDPDLARTRNLPFLFTTFPFFLTLFGPFFTISWIKTLNKIGGPGPDTKIIFFLVDHRPLATGSGGPGARWDRGSSGTGGQVGQGPWGQVVQGPGDQIVNIDQSPGGPGGQVGQWVRDQVGQGPRWARWSGARRARGLGGPGARWDRWSGGPGARRARGTGGPEARGTGGKR